MLYIV